MKKIYLTLVLTVSLGYVHGQMSSGDLAVKLFELANADSTITADETAAIKEILSQYDESYSQSQEISIEYIKPKKRLRKDLNPMTYIKNGLEGGWKNNMYRLQSEIIRDMTDAGREVIEKR